MRPTNTRVSGFIIRAGDYVDGIQLLYKDDRDGDYHGGGGGDFYEFSFDPDEYIEQINGRSGDYVDSLTITTNKYIYGPFGGPGGANRYVFSVPSGYHIVGFAGRAGDYIDAIGIEYRKLC